VGFRDAEGEQGAQLLLGDPDRGDLLAVGAKFRRLCPERAITHETIVTGPRVFPYLDAKFWETYRNQPAWEFARFLKIAEQGKPRLPLPALQGAAAQAREREDLEASFSFTRNILNM
jgi:hypothetical protein